MLYRRAGLLAAIGAVVWTMLSSCGWLEARQLRQTTAVPVYGTVLRAEKWGSIGSYEGPNAFRVYDSEAYILDAKNYRVVVVDLAAEQAVSQITYADEHYFSEMDFDGEHFHLINGSLQRYVVLNRDGVIVRDEIAPSQIISDYHDAATILMEQTNAEQDAAVPARPAYTLERDDRWGPLAVHIEGRSAPIVLESCHDLAGTDLLAADDSGYYFVIEELGIGPDIHAERSVRWYGPDGSWQGAYEVPFREYFVFPQNDVAYDWATGAVYNMIVRADGVEVRGIEWSAPAEYTGRLQREFGPGRCAAPSE